MKHASLLLTALLALPGCSSPPPDYVTPQQMANRLKPASDELYFTVVRDTPFWPTRSTGAPAQGIVHAGTRCAEILAPGQVRGDFAHVWTADGFVCYIARRDMIEKPREKDQH